MARATTLSGLTKMSDRWSVVVRVLRKWTVYRKTNPAEGFCTSMILIDREVRVQFFLEGLFSVSYLIYDVFSLNHSYIIPQGTKIQGSIVGKGLYEKSHDLKHEGRTYCITNFEVIDNAKDYKATPHYYRLLFSASTYVKEESNEVNDEHTNFTPLSDVAGAEETCFPDYFIGRFYLNIWKVRLNVHLLSYSSRNMVTDFLIADVMGLVKNIGSLEEYECGEGKKNKLRMTICDLRFVHALIRCRIYLFVLLFHFSFYPFFSFSVASRCSVCCMIGVLHMLLERSLSILLDRLLLSFVLPG